MDYHSLIDDLVVLSAALIFTLWTKRRLAREKSKILEMRSSLREAEERLSLALSSSGVGTWNWDIMQGVITWDDSHHPLFGMKPGEFSGKYVDFMTAVHPDDRKGLQKQVSNAVNRGMPYDTECRTIWPDGSVHNLACRGRVYRDSNGRPVRMAGVSWDITRQKRAEEELSRMNRSLEERVQRRTYELRLSNAQIRENEEQFRNTFEQAAVGMAHVSANSYRWLRMNDRFCEILGYAREELLELSIQQISDPRDAAESMEGAYRLARGEIPSLHIEKRYVRKDGSSIWVELHSRLVRYEDGSPKYFVSVIQDISQRKEMEQTIKASLGQFQQLAEAIPQQLWRAKPDGALDYFNPQCLEYFGLTREQMVADGWQNVLHPDDLPECIRRWTHALQTGTDYEVEFRLRRFDGEYRWHLGRALPLRGKDGEITQWCGTNTDIQDQRQAEKLVEDQRISMMTASKMSALGEMAGGIAHEINNPLAIIHGKAGQLKEMAEQGQVTATVIQTMAEKIEATALRISRIVKALRSVARDGELDPFVRTPLRQVIEDTLELCHERFRNHGVEVRIADLNPEVTLECRPVQLTQVLLNLLNNAHDAVAVLPEKWVQIDVLARPEGITIRVSDSGLGIPTSIAEKVMQPFFTTKPPGHGTGLGLSVSRGIVEGHKGSIRIDSSAPNTCFEIELPRQQQTAAARMAA